MLMWYLILKVLVLLTHIFVMSVLMNGSCVLWSLLSETDGVCKLEAFGRMKNVKENGVFKGEG
jgi:hypothetical protein